ncbi:hypothetical protein MMC07_000703 [Pseudocyphellaria aurata]|nr:hypothetical protein [Pseudocyphellaria aurata]
MGFASSSILSVLTWTIFTCMLLATAVTTTKARPDFTDCYGGFNDTQNRTGIYDKNTTILYQGLLYGHHEPSSEQRPYILSVEGCRTLCGSGIQYYPWNQVAGTITTWVLPVIGLLLQAPYESNEFRKTLYALVRWLGSPIASLSYILWNIEVIGTCALLADMSTIYSINFAKLQLEDPQGAQDILDMRDSLYILTVMNQYTIESLIDPKHAIALLRVALFADIKTRTLNLKERRRKLAVTFREGRKRGDVPAFITLMWFLFSLAISIQAAFSSVGDNYTAHDLALGLLLTWLPVLILSSIVDRNPTQTGPTRTKLNKLLREVQTDEAASRLVQKVKGDSYARQLTLSRDGRQGAEVLNGNGVDKQDAIDVASNFFNDFAGQGRVRWHYGVAHPILVEMQAIILARCGTKYPRNWLKLPNIKTHLVSGNAKEALLLRFDLREAWQMLGAFLIVTGTISGAFVLSFRTPTIGLGCRSGGYAVFFIIAAVLFFLELLTWYFIIAPTKRNLDRIGGQDADECSHQKQKLIAALNWIFRFGELGNTAWLMIIVMAQTLGSYQSCGCQASTFGPDGGYINVQDALQAAPLAVEMWWIIGTSLSSVIMITAIAFLVIHWCELSHLNSVDLNKAMLGLRVTQHFKYRTLWIRRIPASLINVSKRLWRTLSNSLWNKGKKKEKGRESILWSKSSLALSGPPQLEALYSPKSSTTDNPAGFNHFGNAFVD